MRLSRILVIDDDELNNFALGKFLESYITSSNYIVQTNGWEAIEYLERCKQKKETAPDIIFVDLSMPDMDGFEFLGYYQKNFHAALPKTQLMILTCSTRGTDEEKALAYSCVKGYLSKPLSDEKMTQILGEEV